MRPRDISISTQLRLGLGAILLLVALLGTLAWYQADSLWAETEGLYSHPLMVRRALGEVKADLLSIHRAIKDVLLADTGWEREAAIQAIEGYEADAHRQFTLLYDRYPGPSDDIDSAFNAFVQWKPIREETIRLLREGNSAEAARRTRDTGVGGAHVQKMLSYLEVVSDFSNGSAEQYYRDAQQHRDDLRAQLGGALGALMLMTLGISAFLTKGIQDPLRELAKVARQQRQGKLDVRSHYLASNEFGLLASSLNALADTIESEMLSRERVARIAEVMLKEKELRGFCRELLKALMEHTGSQLGAVYLLDESRVTFERFESIGLSAAGRASFSALEAEGEFGQALATGQIQCISNIPPDTRFAFASVGGDFLPREILTVPIRDGQAVVALVSLASLRDYSPAALRLVNGLWSVLTARLNGVLAFRRIQQFSERLETQNRELESQGRELAAQSAEMREQNAELEQQKRQLDEANRLKSSFLSNMSHELRTPLNSVIALTGVLSRRLKGVVPEEEYGYFEVIERNGKQLLALINDILDLSRLEAGREELHMGRFPIAELVADVVSTVEPLARQKGIDLLDSLDAGLPPLRSDYAKCRHILLNIIGNGVKFTEAGRVEITATRQGDLLRIVVADTGIGIPAGQLPYIFDEFRQVDDSSSRKYGGTGLGLAIARKYATMLRGSISVESSPGRGSTFTLQLPLDSGESGGWEPQAPAPRSMAVPQQESQGQGKRILLVEDSEPALIQMTDILAMHGYQLDVARNGWEALERIKDGLPDALILDLMMPEVDGFQLLRTIRGMERTAQIPVLILTAKHVTPEELSFLQGNHIHQLIQKGYVSGAELISAVARMVSSQPLEELHAE